MKGPIYDCIDQIKYVSVIEEQMVSGIESPTISKMTLNP